MAQASNTPDRITPDSNDDDTTALNEDDGEDDDDPKGLCGLQNLGNTCYMNGALQALSNCQQLTRFVLDCPGYMKRTGLCHSYSELIKEIWDSKRLQYAVPSNIIRGIRGIYPAFRGYTQQDTQEFLRCFLEQLHEELKQPASLDDRIHLREHEESKQSDSAPGGASHIKEGNIDKLYEKIFNEIMAELPSTGQMNGTCYKLQKNKLGARHNKDSISNHQHTTASNTCSSSCSINSSSSGSSAVAVKGARNFEKSDIVAPKKKEIKYRSIISDTFDFKILSSVQCSNCNNVSTTKETFKDLSLPIPMRDHPYWLRTASPSTLDYQDPVTNSHQDPTSTSMDLITGGETVEVKKANSADGIGNQDQTSEEQLAVRSMHIVSLQTAYRWFWDWLSWISGWLWGPSVALQDCLSIFFGADPLEGDNEYSCEKCEKKNRGVKYLKILELPEILCIHFKRYESINSAKITTHVSFPLVGLQLAPYMSEESRAQCTTYNLVACICHHGSALLTGHYTTYALNCFDEQWYEFDDQSVSMVQSYQVENCEAYILFYQKATLDDTTNRRRSKASEILRQNQHRSDLKKYLISRQWINRFNTFVEPGPITNNDFLCEHHKVPKQNWPIVSELCHPITEPVWRYLHDSYGGGPECCELIKCDICKH